MTESLFESLNIGDIVYVNLEYVSKVTDDHSEMCQEKYNFAGNFVVAKIDSINQNGEVECIQDGVDFGIHSHENVAFFAVTVYIFSYLIIIICLNISHIITLTTMQ